MESGSMKSAIRGLFETSKNSDLVITCGKKTFNVHKCIVTSQGGYFDLACKESFKEGQTGKIVLDDDEDVVEAVLKHLYGILYSVPESYDSAATFHALVYAAGEFYQIAQVKEIASHNFAAVAALGREATIDCFAAAEAVYTGTQERDRGLRDHLVRVTNNNLKLLIDNNKKNQSVLRKFPEFAFDLLCSRAAQF